jgi:hypothetical protein
MFDSFMVSQVLQEVNITIVFMLYSLCWCYMSYVDNIVFARKNMVKINRLAQLAWAFEMKDMGEAKQSWAWKYTETRLMVSLGYHNKSMWKRYSGNSV